MQTPSDRYLTSSGPWGKIECFYTYLDPPDSYFNKLVNLTRTEWFFQDHSRDEVFHLFEASGIDPRPLEGEQSWITATNGVLVRPPTSFLDALPPEKHARIARHLLERSANPLVREFVVERGNYREFTIGLDLPEEIIRFTEERCFLMGRKTIFASTSHALSKLPDVSSRFRYLKSLARCRSLMARLILTPDQDLTTIADWWKSGPNRTRALPLLEMALATQGVGSLDLLHLLPPVPRRLLNTYALEQDLVSANAPDCYWAAMNFFESTASNRYLDDQLARSYYFQEHFETVSPPCQFGDVNVIFHPGANQFVHSYITIADDIIYTKNGSGRFFPYVLMRREDMLSRYLSTEELQTEVYRLKNLN